MSVNILFFLMAALALSFLLLTRAISHIRKRICILGRIEAKLDLIMKNAGIEFGPYNGLPAQVVDALNRAEKIVVHSEARYENTRFWFAIRATTKSHALGLAHSAASLRPPLPVGR